MLITQLYNSFIHTNRSGTSNLNPESPLPLRRLENGVAIQYYKDGINKADESRLVRREWSNRMNRRARTQCNPSQKQKHWKIITVRPRKSWASPRCARRGPARGRTQSDTVVHTPSAKQSGPCARRESHPTTTTLALPTSILFYRFFTHGRLWRVSFFSFFFHLLNKTCSGVA